jgi:hypothetical protein
MSEAEDRDLELVEQLELGVHLAMCKGCRNYREHLRVLRQASRAYKQHLLSDDTPDSSPPR